MGTVNKVILVGNLGTDPELRYTSKGTPVCHLSVATSARWKDADGNTQDRTYWHRVVAWGKQGQLCKEYLSKGRQVYIEGRLETSSYNDKDGNKRYSTEVVSNSVVFLGGNGRNGGNGSRTSPPPLTYASAPLTPPPQQQREESSLDEPPF